MASPHLSPDNPIALHGTVHDAAGYLDSFHDEGPGYNYRGSEIEGMVTSAIEMLPESWENTLLPLTGQLSGIAYWTMEAGDEYIEARFDEGLVALEEALDSARDGASDQIDEIVSAIDDAKKAIADQAEELRSDMEDAADQAAEELQDIVDAVETEVLEARDALESGAEMVADSVVETFEEVSDAVGSFGEGVGDKLDAIANFIWN
jgi:methyl-accepting chemotaxis protein